MQTSHLLRIAMVVSLIGGWLRSMTELNDNFTYVMAGSILLAVSSPFVMLSQSLVIKKWFPVDQYTLALSCCTAGIPLGFLISFGMTGIVFRDPNGDTKEQF